MKKRIGILLLIAAFVMIFACACNQDKETEKGSEAAPQESSETATNEADDPYSGQFRAGFGRTNITPDASAALPLAGYGNTQNRLSTGFLDYIFTTCIAISDEKNETILMFTLDLICSNDSVISLGKEMVHTATGVPEDHIVFTATHTHSSIDQSQTTLSGVPEYLIMLENSFVTAAQQALADRAPCKFYWGTADLTGYNYVRHYFTDLDESVGDNHGSNHIGKLNRHTTKANSDMYILKMERETAKDIYLTNWRAHAVLTGRGSSRVENQKTNISADWIGPLRSNIEKEFDAYFAYYQGESGNMNPLTELPSTMEYNPPSDYREYGNEISAIVIKAINDGLEEIATGPIHTMQETFEGKVNHADENLIGIATEIYALWTSTGNYQAVEAKGLEYGIQSPYHAGSIASRKNYGATLTFEIHATVIGDFCFTHAPFELFDTNGTYVRENVPVGHTFILSYSNESRGYLPSQYAFEYGCYESDTARFAAGTAEELATRYVEMITELKNQ